MDTTMHNWDECALWEILAKRNDAHAHGCRITLSRIMPKIQSILKSGGTSPKDFTLHDEGHSFRVAQRMRAIAGDVTEVLSSFELALLLLSAYLHDIGMTPEFKKVYAHHQYLLTGQRTDLTDADIVSLQTWLDNEGYEIVPPFSEATPLVDRLHLAGEITTYYCRHRHNDWSAEWIREHLKSEALGAYDGWLEDLVLLCQSHHFGYGRLKESAFTPRWVSEPPAIVNLRYLALVLRTADILEFDPERTPDVILHHRDVAPESLIYWWKDKGISVKLTDGNIVISARPSSARLHKAIDEMVNAIDGELTLSRNLIDEAPIGALPGSTEPLAYRWELAPVVHRDISPREATYEYIEGAFRPNTKKLLSLLSGVSLYQNPIVAVRELVQNAFDAVCERIAYQRLNQPNPASADLARQLSKQHRVELRVVTINADAYLVCSDTGIGMTKAIIRDRVLVSGSGPRHDVRALDRKCKEAGFQLVRSGQFGIGVLSYFMLGNTVEIETCRAQEAGDSDSTRWSFQTDGIGAFGELRKLGGMHQGTEARLRLRAQFSSDLTAWYSDLRLFLIQILTYVPCEFLLSSPIPGCEPLSLEPGWCSRDISEMAFKALLGRQSNYEGTPIDLVSRAKRERLLERNRQIQALEAAFKSRIRWCVEEGTVANGDLQYQISLPYFEVKGGASLAFLDVTRSGKGGTSLRPFLGGSYYLPEPAVGYAWKGMTVQLSHHFRWLSAARGFIRLNWTSESGGTILVHRNLLSLSEVGLNAVREVVARLNAMRVRFLEEHRESGYAWFNERLAEVAGPLSKRCCWFDWVGGGEGGDREPKALSWVDVKFPAVSRFAFGYIPPSHKFTLNRKTVHIVKWARLSPATHAVSVGCIGWHNRLTTPDRIVELGDWRFGVAPVWLRRPLNIAQEAWLQSSFPQEWGMLCGVSFEWYTQHQEPATVWNRHHPLVTCSSRSAWQWVKKTFATSLDPIPHRDELLADRAKAACWLRLCISTDSNDIWEGLAERDPQLLQSMFDVVFRSIRHRNNMPLLYWVEDPGNGRLRVISPREWTAITDLKSIRQHLPEPTSAWRLTSQDRPRVPRT